MCESLVVASIINIIFVFRVCVVARALCSRIVVVHCKSASFASSKPQDRLLHIRNAWLMGKLFLLMRLSRLPSIMSAAMPSHSLSFNYLFQLFRRCCRSSSSDLAQWVSSEISLSSCVDLGFPTFSEPKYKENQEVRGRGSRECCCQRSCESPPADPSSKRELGLGRPC